MRKSLLVIALAAAVSFASLSVALVRLSHACGGCFSPPEVVTSVNSHRMVVSLSPEKSILWDQIRYTGNPADFVWVLPVPTPDAVVAVSDDLFFAELEAQTAPVVNAPPLPPLDCPPPPDDGWGGGGDSAGNQDAGAGEPDVDVYREEVVGPYQTAVIGSDDPGALVAWLNDNGYNVPESTTPTIQHYTQQNMVFVVLRLAPQQGVGAMQPVRIEYPGYMASFPLKMVTVGAYGSLAMTLWVIAEQRYRPVNYGDGVIDAEKLVWDFDTASSNYRDIFRDTVIELGSRAWITQYANPLDYLWFDSPEVATARAAIPYPFITRMETDMLVDHLSEDLQLGPSSGDYLNNWLTAGSYINEPERTCPDYDDDGEPDTWPQYYARNDRDFFGCNHCAAGGGAGAGATAGLLVVACLLAFRRRKKG